MIVLPQPPPTGPFFEKIEEVDLSILAQSFTLGKKQAVTALVVSKDRSNCLDILQIDLNGISPSYWSPSVHYLLRTGLYQEHSIFILDETAECSTSSLAELLRTRMIKPFAVVSAREIRKEGLENSINVIIRQMEKEQGIDEVVDDYISSSKSQNEISGRRVHRTFDTELVSHHQTETEFKDLLKSRLSQFLSSTPEKILEQAIKEIRKKK